jgi:uncharacterized membrane protein
MGWWIVSVLAAFVVLYGFAYVALGERVYASQLAASFRARPWGIYPHAFFGALALGLGPLQFHQGLRLRRRALHRTLGKLYVASCLFAGTAGVYMAFYAFGGWPARMGFGTLAMLLLIITSRAYAAARRVDIATHRAWMLRSYALIFAAVTLRLELPLLIAAFGDFLAAYRTVAWLSWVPNLLWAEWYVRRSRQRELPELGEIRVA